MRHTAPDPGRRRRSTHFGATLAVLSFTGLLFGAAGEQGDVAATGCTPDPRTQFRAARFFAYQLQGLDAAGAIDAIAASRYDMLVLEPTRSDKSNLDFDAAGMVRRVHESLDHDGGRGKLALAYIDIGEAEEWRWYWGADWIAPTPAIHGVPDFLIAPDPGGWSGNYPVAFWDPRWKTIMIGTPGSGSSLDQVLADGFDGVYMDWIEAYSDPDVAAEAARQGVDPAVEMIRFIAEIRDAARVRHPGFIVVAQNATDLKDGHPEYFSVIDGLAQEDLSFGGEADVAWSDPRAGDIRNPNGARAYLASELAPYRDASVKVMTVDYARNTANRAESYSYSSNLGFVPFVSLTPLDRLPPWTPPGY